MRKIMEPQLKIGEVAISDIKFDLTSRDEIPKLLIGLQAIYCNRKIRDKIFEVLEAVIPSNVDKNNGRPGMNLWRIIVLGTLRLCCNWDYDKLMEIANNHITLRLMLGHSYMDDQGYALQTLKDNISLFTPELLDRINQIVISFGHDIIGFKKDDDLKGSCDTFVAETDVHYPTDINLLLDAIRKIIMLVMSLCDQLGLAGWRQGIHNFKKVKKLFFKAQRIKNSTSKDPNKKKERAQLIIDIHLAYIELAQSIIDRVKETISSALEYDDILTNLRIFEIEKYIKDADREIDQIRRRVAEGETIPHHEKVFSIFEEHTEWIKKGKSGVPQELGLKVCVVKDQFGFILYHQVIQNQTDNQIAVPVIQEIIKRFPNFSSCSFDKGFHSPDNQKELSKILDLVILPRKGRLSEAQKEIENSDEFKERRRKHSAIESSINALENHGLDRCPDHGIDGFKRYVALAVLARNIQILGNIIQQKALKKRQREAKRERLAA